MILNVTLLNVRLKWRVLKELVVRQLDNVDKREWVIYEVAHVYDAHLHRISNCSLDWIMEHRSLDV